MDTSEFVRLELLIVGALFAGLALLIPKIIRATRGVQVIAAPPSQPVQPVQLAGESVGVRLIMGRLGSIDKQLEKADESRAKFHARIDDQAKALAEHEKGCYERAAMLEVRMGRIEDLLGRLEKEWRNSQNTSGR